MKALTAAFRITPTQVSILWSASMIALAYALLVSGWVIPGWVCLAIGAVIASVRRDKRTRSYLLLIAGAIGIMMITPVSTNTQPLMMALMFSGMFVAVALPYFVSHKIFKHPLIHFALDIRNPLTKHQVFLILFAVVVASPWIILYFMTSGAHEHWPLGNASDISIVFGSIMAIGLWEEFLFIATIFGVLSRILPVGWANILQATMFTAFLYQIGFVGWIVVNTFLYALYQGYVFYSTKRLLVSVIIHVIIDLIVFGALVYAAYR